MDVKVTDILRRGSVDCDMLNNDTRLSDSNGWEDLRRRGFYYDGKLWRKGPKDDTYGHEDESYGLDGGYYGDRTQYE